MVQFSFDSTGVPTQVARVVVPTGLYKCRIIESIMKPTASNSGQMLVLTFEIIEGEHRGVTVLDRLNLFNANAETVRIAKSQLATLCQAVGRVNFTDTFELHNRPVIVAITERPPSVRNGKSYGASNEVAGYQPVTQSQTATQNGYGNGNGYGSTDAPPPPPPPPGGNFGGAPPPGHPASDEYSNQPAWRRT